MTNDKQAEVWREDFERWFNGKTKNNGGVAYYVGADGKYCFTDIEIVWQAWIAAKRSMPPIELPQEDFLVGSAGQVDAIYFCNQIKDAITEAGYSYKVKN